jgi:outer membrane protein
MTRKLQALLFTLTLAAGSAAFGQVRSAAATTSAAPAAAATKIGIIDFVAAVANTNEGKRDLAALQAKFLPKKNDLEAKQTEITNLQKQLQAQSSVLSEDNRSKMENDLAQKEKDFKREGEDAESDFNQQQQDIFQRIGAKLYETLDRYAKQNGYAVIIDISNPQQSSVRWAADSVNIGPEVVALYNTASGVPAPAAPKPAGARPGTR